MVTYKIKKQNGFLLIVALMLITVVSFVGCMLTHMFSERINANINNLQSYKAHYIAVSGLEIAKRDIIKNETPPAALPSTYKVCGGTITTKGIEYSRIPENRDHAQLYSTIGPDNTTIPVAGNKPSEVLGIEEGIVAIDAELMYYPNRDVVKQTLNNVVRGVLNTQASGHVGYLDRRGASLMMLQNCDLTITGSFGSISRTIKQIIQEESSGFRYYSIFPTVVSSPASSFPITLSNGGVIWNSQIMTGESGNCISGSNIVTPNDVNIGSSASTIVGADIIGPPPASATLSVSKACSTSAETKHDVITKYKFRDNFSSYFFTGNCDTRYTTKTYSCVGNDCFDKINGISDSIGNAVIYIDSDLIVSGEKTSQVGIDLDPVRGGSCRASIVQIRGDLTLKNKAKLVVYGIIIVNGNVFVDGATLEANGQLVVDGKITVTNSGKILNTYQAISRMVPFYCKGGGYFNTINMTPANVTIHRVYAE